MTDKELLEAAARAAGEWPSPEPFEHVMDRWNPLTDDGDALRLAVKLRIWLRYRDDNTVNACWYDKAGFFAGNTNEGFGSLRNGDEPNAAVRRAIVRAAAALAPSTLAPHP